MLFINNKMIYSNGYSLEITNDRLNNYIIKLSNNNKQSCCVNVWINNTNNSVYNIDTYTTIMKQNVKFVKAIFIQNLPTTKINESINIIDPIIKINEPITNLIKPRYDDPFINPNPFPYRKVIVLCGEIANKNLIIYSKN